MSDQIKVLSRDEVENLTESLVELVRHECRCGRTRFNFQHLPEVSRALDWIEMDIEKALREKLTVLIDEHEEPAPKWEPGTVLINRQGWKYRLDKLIEANDPEMWEYTNMQSGRTSPGLFYPFAYKIHRLPHEFKVGDWAQWIDHTPGPFQVMNVQAVDGRETLYGFGAFLPAEECCHVPPPKEEKPSDHEFGMQAQAEEEKPENPFTGPHWDEVTRDANRDDALAETLCIKDLRDELNRLAGRKP